MRFRRSISVLTLSAFIPLAVGCSSQRTMQLDSDPAQTHPVAAANEPIKISGYTTVDSGFHDWSGHMRVVQPDSLEFSRVPRRGSPNTLQGRERPGDEVIRLAQAQVLSVQVVESDPARTVLFVIGLVAIAALAVPLALYSMDPL